MLSPNDLQLDLIPHATRAVIDRLAQETALASFCLIGGTALALQAGHRRSLDVDLVCFSETLDKNGLFHTLRNLGAALITPHRRFLPPESTVLTCSPAPRIMCLMASK